MPDVGLTHVALVVADLDASVAFYAKYAGMRVVHTRADPVSRTRVAWITDGTRPFVIVLVGAPPSLPRRLVRWLGRLVPAVQHLGVACPTRDAVDRLCAEARRDGCLRRGPTESPPPVGYWAFIESPDGHMLELSFGQEVGLALRTPGS